MLSFVKWNIRMNPLDFYTKLYSVLRNYWMPIWVMTPARRIVRSLANKSIPNYLRKPMPMDKERRKKKIIVSFTSFPARINNVWQVVECLKRQTVAPDKIILWLSKEQFSTHDSIPLSLQEREGDVFEIRFVDGDLRSHKKYFYVSQEYPNEIILLVDDDIYYPTDFINRLYEAYRSTGLISCNYGYTMKYGDDGIIQPYKTWEPCYNKTECNDFFFGSGGGVMFQPSKLYKDLINLKLALELTPNADDIWLNAMVRLGGQKTIKIESGLFLPINEGENNKRLAESNNIQGGNDVQIAKLNEYYKEVLGITVFGSRIKEKENN